MKTLKTIGTVAFAVVFMLTMGLTSAQACPKCEDVMASLNLTEAQKTQIEGIKTKCQGQKSGRAAVAELNREIFGMVEGGKASDAEIDAKIGELNALQERNVRARVTALTQMAGVLDDTQRASFFEQAKTTCWGRYFSDKGEYAKKCGCKGECTEACKGAVKKQCAGKCKGKCTDDCSKKCPYSQGKAKKKEKKNTE